MLSTFLKSLDQYVCRMSLRPTLCGASLNRFVLRVLGRKTLEVILCPDMGYFRPVWWQKNGQGRGRGRGVVRGHLAR